MMSHDLQILYVAVLKLGCEPRMSRLNDFEETTRVAQNEYFITIENDREDVIRVKLEPGDNDVKGY